MVGFLDSLGGTPQSFYSNNAGNPPLALGGTSTNPVDFMTAWNPSGVATANQLLGAPTTAAQSQSFINSLGGMNPMTTGNPASGSGGGLGNFLSSLNTKVGQQGGWGNVLGGLNTLMQMWTAWDTRKLANKQFNQSKKQFDLKWGAFTQDYENKLDSRYTTLAAADAADNRTTSQNREEYIEQRKVG